MRDSQSKLRALQGSLHNHTNRLFVRHAVVLAAEIWAGQPQVIAGPMKQRQRRVVELQRKGGTLFSFCSRVTTALYARPMSFLLASGTAASISCRASIEGWLIGPWTGSLEV